MKQVLAHFIRLTVKNPNEEEINAILEIFHLKEFAKGAFFKHPNQACRSIGYLVEGSVRYYMIKSNGSEITGRIVEKNNFITDLISVRTQGLTPTIIETLEPTTMLVTSLEDYRKLLETNLTFNILVREYMADRVAEMGKLYFLFLNGTAKERYRFILENNPELLKNIPLRFIASMIGITPTQLSRIRNKKKD